MSVLAQVRLRAEIEVAARQENESLHHPSMLTHRQNTSIATKHSKDAEVHTGWTHTELSSHESFQGTAG